MAQENEEKKPWWVFKFNKACKLNSFGCECCGYFHGSKDEKRAGLKIEFDGTRVVTKDKISEEYDNLSK